MYVCIYLFKYIHVCISIYISIYQDVIKNGVFLNIVYITSASSLVTSVTVDSKFSIPKSLILNYTRVNDCLLNYVINNIVASWSM